MLLCPCVLLISFSTALACTYMIKGIDKMPQIEDFFHLNLPHKIHSFCISNRLLLRIFFILRCHFISTWQEGVKSINKIIMPSKQLLQPHHEALYIDSTKVNERDTNQFLLTNQSRSPLPINYKP